MKSAPPNSPLMSEPFSPSRPQLTQNALFWPAAGVYLKSTHVHDYVGQDIEIAPGLKQSLALDGGLEYSRVVSSGNPVYEDFSLWKDSPFDMVADRFLWGAYGPNGDQPLRWVPLKECETDHLQAILRTQLHIYGTVVDKVIRHWLSQRGVKPEACALTLLCKELKGLAKQTGKAAKKSPKRKARK